MTKIWSTEGRMLNRDGVPRICIGMYDVDYTCTGGNAAEIARAARIAIMAEIGVDVVALALDDDNALTMAAVAAGGMRVCVDFNTTEADVEAAHGPFDFALVYDDVDSGGGTTHTVTDVNNRITTLSGICAGPPLMYASGGYPAYLPAYGAPACHLDVIAMQSYPIPAEPISVAHNSWSAMQDATYKPFICNVQAYSPGGGARWPSEGEIMYMSQKAMECGAAGIWFYTFKDTTAGNDLSLPARAEQLSGIRKAIAEIREKEDFWLTRLSIRNA